MNGYWQSSRYFEDAEQFLRADFSFKNDWDEANTAIAEAIGASDIPTVSAHVRRGDYVTDPGANRRLGTLAPSYYPRALERIQAEAGPAHIFDFSDEPQWCRDHLDDLGYETTIVDVNTPSQGATICASWLSAITTSWPTALSAGGALGSAFRFDQGQAGGSRAAIV